MVLAACLCAAGCAGPRHPGSGSTPGIRTPGLLVTPLFEPGPSTQRFASESGPVTRVRTAPDASGVWTSTTAGPGETSVLTLRRDAEGGVRLLSLVSGDRDVVCPEPGLVIEPAGGTLPHAAEGPCTIDGKPGTARTTLEEVPGDEHDAPEPAHQRVRLTLEFAAWPATARRTFDWRVGAGEGILEEHARLGVRVLGVTVRSRSRDMTRTP